MNAPKLGALILALSISGCLWPSAPETPVKLTDTQWADYWSRLERSWPAFFESQCVKAPGLPLMNDVREWVKEIVEVPNEWMTERGVACTYSRKHRKIRIGDNRWDSCVPHELGHAACHLLGVDVCVDFEHREYISQC